MEAVPAGPALARPANRTVAVPSAAAPTPGPAADLVAAPAADHPTNQQEVFIRGNCFQENFSARNTFWT